MPSLRPAENMHFPIETSIATVCLSGSLPEKLEAIAHAGFDAVEIFENDLIQFDGTPQQVRDLTKKHGLRVSLYQPFRDLEGVLNPVIRKRTFERLERKLQLMQELETDMILLCSNVGECSGDMDVIVQDLKEAAELAAKYNMKIAYEALSWGISRMKPWLMNRNTCQQVGDVMENRGESKSSESRDLPRYVLVTPENHIS
jgi:sugar phosphate isomerase/epimerase